MIVAAALIAERLTEVSTFFSMAKGPDGLLRQEEPSMHHLGVEIEIVYPSVRERTRKLYRC